MKHKEFLSGLTDEQIKQLIDDIDVLHHVEGELPKGSMVKVVAELTSKDYNVPFNLTYGETAIMWEVYKRFKNK